MDRRYWVVLKVILARPWTKLMLGIWILAMFGVLVPLQNLDSFRQPTLAIPDFDQPGIAILEISDIRRFKGVSGEELSDVETLDSAALPDTSLVIVNGDLARASAGIPAAGSWSVLEQLSQLKSLRIQPQHLINADGWERIGQLPQLESLWVQNASPESADKRQDAIESASRVLSQLSRLRQINVVNSSFSVLPPMPNLEYAVLDSTRSLEQNLKTLADHSPKLRELALRPYAGFQLTSSMRDSLQRMSSLRTIWIWSGLKSDTDVLTPQLASLRASLPQVNVLRGEYSRLRSNSVFIAFAIMIWPWIIFSTHGFLMQSLPFAAYFPGHSRPHLFWQLLCAFLLVVCFTLVVCYFGVAWYAAAAMSLYVTFSSMLCGDQWSPWLRRTFRAAQWLLLAAMGTFVLSLVSSPLLAEEFLAGDFPTFAAALLLLGGLLIPFRTAASTQRHRAWAEMGSPTLPGMQFGLEQTGSASRSGSVRSNEGMFSEGFMRLQDLLRTRRLSNARSQNFTAKLTATTSGNAGRVFLFLVIIVGVLTLYRYLLSSSKTPMLGVAVFQGAVMNLTVSATTWLSRRSSLALDLLRPVSRKQFWRSVRIGVLKDMLPTFLMLIVGVFALIWTEHHNPFAVWSVLIPIVLLSGIGSLSILHALVVWICVSERLWLTVTVSIIALMIVASMAVTPVPLILSKGVEGEGIAILLSALLVAGGIIAQLALARSLPHRELGMIGQ